MFFSSFNKFIKRLMFLIALYCWVSTREKKLFKLFFVIPYRDNWLPCLCISNSFQIQFATRRKKYISAQKKVREQVKTLEPSCAAKLRSSPLYSVCSPYSPKGNWNLGLSVTEIHSCQRKWRKFTYSDSGKARLYRQTELGDYLYSQVLYRYISTSGFESTKRLYSGFISKWQLD